MSWTEHGSGSGYIRGLGVAALPASPKASSLIIHKINDIVHVQQAFHDCYALFYDVYQIVSPSAHPESKVGVLKPNSAERATLPFFPFCFPVM